MPSTDRAMKQRALSARLSFSLRWKSSRYGTVPPDQFIPILESDPLFPELGEWILREAIAGSKKMRQQNPGFVISVNLSYSQLEKPDFADRVLQILKEQGYL